MKAFPNHDLIDFRLKFNKRRDFQEQLEMLYSFNRGSVRFKTHTRGEFLLREKISRPEKVMYGPIKVLYSIISNREIITINHMGQIIHSTEWDGGFYDPVSKY